MLSSILKRAARSPRARRTIESIPVTRRVVGRFVAGEAVEEAVRVATDLREAGFHVTVDVLGEDVHDLAGARGTRDSYLALLSAMNDVGCAQAGDVSLKLSALGQALPGQGDDIALAHAYEISAAAEAVGCTVTLDMEDHTTVDSALLIGEKLRADFPDVGNVLQSNLKRTPGDLSALVLSRARIRLVKGAYREPVAVAHQRKADVDAAYRADIDVLMSSSCYPMIATHDPEMIAAACQAAERSGRSDSSWETQMLYGIRKDLQRDALAAERRIRVYLPFGTDWYGYFMRRLAERPANVAFFLKALARP
jgi:proline dehydrogenase